MSKIIDEGLTFDDVLLIPQYSNVLPNSVSLATKLTDDLLLNKLCTLTELKEVNTA